MSKKFLINSIVISLFVVSSPVFAKKHPVTGEELSKDQTYTYRLLDEIASLDPQINEGVEGSVFARDLFEGLLNEDEKGNLVPGVAVSWNVENNNRLFTFKLRKNAKWSNGDTVKAQDFVYGWQRAADPELASPYQWYIQLMSIVNAEDVIKGKKPLRDLGVKALDDFTLQVELDKPLVYFPHMVVYTTTFPAHRKTIEKYGKDWVKLENMVSNGAYILQEYKLNERSVRVRNPLYWNDKATIIDKVVALVINDENTALTRYFAGEIDTTEVPAGQFKALKKKYPNQATNFPRLCSYYYTFNLSPTGLKAFKDVRVRLALSYAIDRRVITENILQGGQFEAYSFTPEATAGFIPPKVEIKSLSQAERDKKAKELLQQAGYGKSNPLKFEMLFNTSESHKQIALVLSQMWKQKLGVEVTIANMEWKTFLDTRSKQNFELARGAWCGDYNEASTFLDLMTTNSGYNDGKFSNAAYDQLIESAKTAKNPEKNYMEAEKIIMEQAPIIPIYHYTGNRMIKPTLKGWPIDNIMQTTYSRILYKTTK